ncbi:MAG TPA: phage tail sheath subtilisin-like domain-containing protein, partial [Pyrinomonadaceae bacterium]|nr:phage tail sheath subtilisin-like domain-containing protein [Pyrinomonadaceae bacterium]
RSTKTHNPTELEEIMTEYLFPGVYVEEVSFRAKSIEGVNTSAGFAGPARYGPVGLNPEVITNLVEFEHTYGDGNSLEFDGAGKSPNYLWHSVRAFFEEGGRRLRIVRVFRPFPWQTDSGVRERIYKEPSGEISEEELIQTGESLFVDGHARAWIYPDPVSKVAAQTLFVRARFPGTAGNLRVRLTPKLRRNILTERKGKLAQQELRDGDIVWTIAVKSTDSRRTNVWDNISLDPRHPARNDLPIVILFGEALSNGLDVLQTFLAYGSSSGTNEDLKTHIMNLDSTAYQRSIEIVLSGGNDGQLPSSREYTGYVETGSKFGLAAFEDFADISIVATPGATSNYKKRTDDANAIVDALISHAERIPNRIAIIDSGENQTTSEARAMRARTDSKHAAFYYPWITVKDPIANTTLNLPPSGFVAGIYVRNDFNHGPHNAPVNELVSLAVNLERALDKREQETLNTEGINCFRSFRGWGLSFFTGRGFDFFKGRGSRLLGARLASSDAEWKHVSVRRYFIYLERSIDKETQWAVFEPNGEALWANVRRTVEDFLLEEWKSGALMGAKPEQAFFVRCDRSTMTQNDLDNGRLICLVGVAPLRPAEFVIFRIGQWTRDRKPDD